MTINDEHLLLAERLLVETAPPAVVDIHLPRPSPDNQKQDEFGIIFLEDGSAGAFYVSLEDSLEQLRHHQLPRTKDLPSLLARRTLAERALGIGLLNALSASVMKRAGFEPQRAARSDGERKPRRGETVGMVGYFCPLVEKLTSNGCDIIVLERQPERVVTGPQVAVATDPAVLAGCDSIICTGATLINDSLDELLATAGSNKPFNLIGPTASLLPDVLFRHGVTATGGVFFADAETLKEKLAAGESWGPAGQKFQLTPSSYPGVDALIEAAARSM